MKKMEYDEFKPLFVHDDGSMVLMEEVEEALRDMPLNEGQERLHEIRIDCTVEEYMQQYNCVFAEDFDNKIGGLYTSYPEESHM